VRRSIDGEPADVAAIVARNGEWLAGTPAISKLLLTFEGDGGLSNAPAVVEWVRGKLEVVALGPAGHHAPEDAPAEIAQAISRWLDRRGE
jgi:haloalkane dehalogenase